MRKSVALLLALPVLFAACGGEDEPAAGGAPARGERPVVVASTTQLGDIVRQVAGDAAEVHQVLQPNSDPHDYEPRPDDVKAVAGAKVVFESGNELDHWMEEMVEQAGTKPTEVAIAPDHTPHKVAAGEDEHHEEEEAEGEEQRVEFDPHWWHDPRNVAAAIPRHP